MGYRQRLQLMVRIASHCAIVPVEWLQPCGRNRQAALSTSTIGATGCSAAASGAVLLFVHAVLRSKPCDSHHGQGSSSALFLGAAERAMVLVRTVRRRAARRPVAPTRRLRGAAASVGPCSARSHLHLITRTNQSSQSSKANPRALTWLWPLTIEWSRSVRRWRCGTVGQPRAMQCSAIAATNGRALKGGRGRLTLLDEE